MKVNSGAAMKGPSPVLQPRPTVGDYLLRTVLILASSFIGGECSHLLLTYHLLTFELHSTAQREKRTHCTPNTCTLCVVLLCKHLHRSTDAALPGVGPNTRY